MFPSNAIIALALVIAAALLVLDWYIWRTGPVLPYKGSRPPTRATMQRRASQRLSGEDGVSIDPDWPQESSSQPVSANRGNEQATHI